MERGLATHFTKDSRFIEHKFFYNKLDLTLMGYLCCYGVSFICFFLQIVLGCDLLIRLQNRPIVFISEKKWLIFNLLKMKSYFIISFSHFFYRPFTKQHSWYSAITWNMSITLFTSIFFFFVLITDWTELIRSDRSIICE